MSGIETGPSRRRTHGSLARTPCTDLRGAAAQPSTRPPVAAEPDRPSRHRPDDLVRDLVVQLRSGGRDLHGGQDRLDLVVELAGTGGDRGDVERVVVAGVEHGRWWLDHSEHAVRLVLPRPTPAADLRALEVVAHLRGGPPDRTWDLDAMSVAEAGGAFRVHARGAPLRRFPVGEGRRTASRCTSSPPDLRGTRSSRPREPRRTAGPGPARRGCL